MQRLKNNNLLKRSKEKLLILILITTLFVSLSWQLLGSEAFNKFANLRLENQMLSAEKERLLELTADETQITTDGLDPDVEEARLTALFQFYSALPTVLSALDTVLSAYPDSITALRLGGTVIEEEYISLALILKAEGRPIELQALLTNLEKFPHMLLIDTLQWSAKSGNEVSLDLGLRLIFLADY